ncbi:Alpha/Beta hydrolase protein [Neohortaea acidophila]|uniref:Alpha/Beta hydrolase protein n=1 Tax=Neohortaea acidophila TaxID=245834 RepID=A0A6A6Q2S8_9PEZI|nr:Alpha/Beta hydrolase protein [Neohortaea acidophila]KAF2486595.1 Alpha/Beta hydrolase protein [Neohortaea acidophila]
MASIKPSKTLTYKTVDGVEIPLDLYLPSTGKSVGVLLWFHGGGLLQGRRDSCPPHVRKAVEKYGIAVASADYRLAPQVSVADIRDDVLDCIKFIREELPSHVKPHAIDVSRLAVSGASAGGYLTLLAGLYANPKPQVILPIYAITDPLGVFFTNPQPAFMGRRIPSKEEMAEYLDRNAVPSTSSGQPDVDPRGHMYMYMLASANLAELYHVPTADKAEPFRVARNIYQHRLPPMYCVHGDADTAVGVEQSDEVVGAALGCGIELKYERLHGLNHFLDAGEDYENEPFYSFMMKHL